MNCFVGTEDLVPGLSCDKMPNPRQGGNLARTIELPLITRTTLYIHNIQMLTTTAFESRFENFLRRLKAEKTRDAKGRYSYNTA